MAFGPGTKGNGELPLPQTMCDASWQLLSSSWSPITTLGIVRSGSQNIAAIRWALLMIAKTHTWCILTGQAASGFHPTRWQKRATLRVHLFGSGVPFSTHSLGSRSCGIFKLWNGSSVTLDGDKGNQHVNLHSLRPDLIDKKSAVSVHSDLLFSCFLYPPKENSTFVIS